MLIGIDARMLGPQCGGLGRYVEQLVRALQSTDTENEYALFFRKNNWDRFSPSTSRFRKVLADIPWYSISEQMKLPALIREERVDLMHFPHWNVPLLYRAPFVVTIHDLIMWHEPREEASTLGPCAHWVKDRASRAVLRSAARRAKHILTTSEFTKQDIHDHLRVLKEKMTVTYQAPCISQVSDVKCHVSAYGITKPYILYVGHAYPHKNLERLADAWKLVNEKTAGGYQLVFVGKKNFFYERLARYIDISTYQNIRLTGFVEDDMLTALYRGASLCVAPSLYEGFALPALEAMAAGVPVAASNRSCFPEVLGEGAIYFDPENIEHMAQVILTALCNPDVQWQLRERAKEELRRFSWQRFVAEMRAVYQRALA